VMRLRHRVAHCGTHAVVTSRTTCLDDEKVKVKETA
jgi:hypothetical protein